MNLCSLGGWWWSSVLGGGAEGALQMGKGAGEEGSRCNLAILAWQRKQEAITHKQTHHKRSKQTQSESTPQIKHRCLECSTDELFWGCPLERKAREVMPGKGGGDGGVGLKRDAKW